MSTPSRFKKDKEIIAEYESQVKVLQALAYFEQLKVSPDAWQVCAEALAQRPYSDDHIKFFCFQVLEHQVKYKKFLPILNEDTGSVHGLE